MAQATRDSAFPGPRENPSERTFLGGSSFGARFGWLIVFALLAAGAAGGALYLADQRAGRLIQDFGITSDLARRIARIETGVNTLRSEAASFIANNSARAAESYRRIGEGLSVAVRNLIDDPAAIDAQRIATTLNDGLTQHVEQFSNVTRIVGLLGAEPGTGLIGNTQSAGQALERRIADVSAPFAQRVTQLRRIEAALVAGNAVPGDRAIGDDIDEFRRAVADSTLTPGNKIEIDRLAEAYAADIGQLARTRASLSAAIARLREIEAYMTPALEALTTFATDTIQEQRRDAARERMELRILIAGSAAGALLFMWLCAVVVLRSVTRPVVRLARSAAELAHGNQLVAIPALGNDDAIGAVARALTYFRENLIQADRLRKELETALQRVDAAQSVANSHASVPALPESNPAIEVEAPRGGRALVPAQPDREAGTQISIISRMLADTSQTASAAAGEAERTEAMVTGLADGLHRIDEIETLLASISDQMSLLAVQTALTDDADDERENLVLLAEKRAGDGGRRVGQSVADRIETIQSGIKRAIKSVQQIGRSISEVNEVAVQFAAEASSEALDAATELLRQSEDLRGMLDDLLTKIRAEGGAAPQATRGRQSD